jgi:hypothetical protein
MRTLLFASLLTLGFTACSGPYFYQPANQQPEMTQVVYTNGRPAVRAFVDNADVSADLTRSSNASQWLNVNVYVRNQSDSSLTFYPEDVNVYGYNEKGEAQKLRVFTAKEFVRRRNTRNAIIAGAVVATTVAVVVADAKSNGGGSGRPGNNENFGNNYWANDWWWVWAATPTVVINNGLAVAPAFQPPYVAPDGLVRRHTLYSDEALQGTIKVRLKGNFDHKFLVEIPVNGYYAKFVFDEPGREL